MPFQITILPTQQTITANADENILDAALRQGVLLPYACRSGTCGACQGKVLSGEVQHSENASALSAAERQAGFALFCCAKARSHLTISSEGIGDKLGDKLGIMPVKTLPARIQKLSRVAPDVLILELKLPPSEPLQFLPGQYIDILLADGRRRAFSLANAPQADGQLQLHIRRVPGGKFTEALFNTVRERDMLRINGPHGRFFLREDSQKPIIFIAAGVGFSPIKAMIEHAIAQKILRPMFLFWGASQRSGLYLMTQANAWVEQQPNIHFVPVLSQASVAWSGRTGLVHQVVMHDFPDLSGHQVYVCGSPAMVAAARQDLITQCHLPESELFSDAFEFSNDAAHLR